MSTQSQLKHVPAGAGRTYWGPGDEVRFILTGEDTGVRSMAEVTVPPAGSPPHLQRNEDEAFFLLQGTVTLQVEGKTIDASAGDFVLVPRGTVHSFKNTSIQHARMLVICTPAGAEGFFEGAFYPAQDGATAPATMTEELKHRMLAAAGKYGMEILPPPQK
ncbi:MAG: cupin domain-containing protein [Nitrospiraceae bacterium]